LTIVPRSKLEKTAAPAVVIAVDAGSDVAQRNPG
jgi:hypothetical protein